jgi:hypothetical protein
MGAIRPHEGGRFSLLCGLSLGRRIARQSPNLLKQQIANPKPLPPNLREAMTRPLAALNVLVLHLLT